MANATELKFTSHDRPAKFEVGVHAWMPRCSAVCAWSDICVHEFPDDVLVGGVKDFVSDNSNPESCGSLSPLKSFASLLKWSAGNEDTETMTKAKALSIGQQAPAV